MKIRSRLTGEVYDVPANRAAIAVEDGIADIVGEAPTRKDGDDNSFVRTSPAFRPHDNRPHHPDTLIAMGKLESETLRDQDFLGE